jgi:hypothetical protein
MQNTPISDRVATLRTFGADMLSADKPKVLFIAVSKQGSEEDTVAFDVVGY